MKRIASIFLSLIILLSSMGITLSTHYCMGRAVDTELMVGVHNLSCGMMDMDAGCEFDGTTTIMPPGCCDNDHFSIQIDDDYQLSLENISLDRDFLYAFTYAFLIDNNNQDEQFFAHSEIYPPPLDQDYQSLYQSFLL